MVRVRCIILRRAGSIHIKHQWDNQKLRILEKVTGNVTLKVPFVKFVKVLDGNFIILGGSLGILVDKVA